MTDLQKWVRKIVRTLTDEESHGIETHVRRGGTWYVWRSLNTGVRFTRAQCEALLAYRDEVAADPDVSHTIYTACGLKFQCMLRHGILQDTSTADRETWLWTPLGRAVLRVLEVERA